MNINTDLLELSGRARIRAMFHPRQKVGLIGAGKVIGTSYAQLHRRIKQGKLTLKIRKDEFGQMYVNVDDLASYLYPDEPKEGSKSSESPMTTPQRKPGRPRKTVTSDGQKGGAR
ncbi:MAG: hypothetical protein ACYCT9_12765 [Leptospirillum sp.]